MQAYGPPSMQEIKVNEYSVQLHAAHPVGCSLTAPCKKLLRVTAELPETKQQSGSNSKWL